MAVNFSRIPDVAVCKFEGDEDEEGAANSIKLDESVCCGVLRRADENNVSDNFFFIEKRSPRESCECESTLHKREMNDSADDDS